MDDTVSQPPERLELWFAEKADLALSSIKLRSAEDSTRALATGKVMAGSEAASIVVTVDTLLEPGGYVVAWRTASADGHVIRGRYRFSVQ